MNAHIQHFRDNPDGVTLDRWYGDIWHGSGYVVGGKANTLILCDDDFSPETCRLIEAWIEGLLPMVEYVGSWRDNGRLYVDACDIVGDLASAVELAEARGELAIYDANEGVVIDLR